MLVKSWRFITFILSALVTGMALCHALELTAKMQYSASQYIGIQNSLYVAFGHPNISAFIESAAPLAAIALAVLVRKRRPALQLTFSNSTLQRHYRFPRLISSVPGPKMQGHFCIEPLEEGQQLAFAEPLKLPFHQMRDFRLGNAEQVTDFPLFQVALS